MTRKYTKELLEQAVSSSYSWAQVLRTIGLQDAGASRSNIQRSVRDYGIPTNHFTGQGHNKGKSSPRKKECTEYLVLRPVGSRKLTSSVLRRAMIEYGFVYQCCFDDCPTRGGWINGPITFEIDHIDGNNINNSPENLRFICAICHSQQPTSTHNWQTRYSCPAASICGCGARKATRSVRCFSCYNVHRRSGVSATVAKKRPTKISWPDLEVLEAMLSESNYTQVAKQLGVSDNAVRKRIKMCKEGVDSPYKPVV